MRIIPKNVRKFQEGGAMPPEDPGMAPEEGALMDLGGGEDPMMQIAQAAMLAVQAQDGNLALQVCEMLVLLLLQGAPGGGAPPEGEPVFRKGGRLAYRIKR